MTIRSAVVVGAAGNAAGHVVTSLAEKGLRVRGFIRASEKRRQVMRRGASEVAVGDLSRGEDVKAALSGVDAVFYVPPAFIDGEAELGVAVVEQARAAGVRRFVFSSVIHPSLGLQNHAAKAPVEAALYDSGMEYAVFQPALFFQNFAAGWDNILRTGVLAEPWSSETRFSRVDYRDVADAVALALTEDRLIGGTYELASAGQLDRRDVADLISRVVGRPIRASRVDPDQLGGIKPAMRAMFGHYEHSGLVSTDVTLTAVLGRPPRTLEAYFRELARRG
ncbi:NmrA family NAD(P)-binding protein [Mycolicibacterium smegmatis]|uniref:NmrA family NAD(P)-binding protein n=1 Tax=Mycolicibacterium smegmatis TaxID=1772 RepID=UPI001E580D00|nr:NmrA family NAD(P)-binding protein [Mycolicibacterium smegmatis]UGU32489.1 NmrA family NAD(P)-binding protein [Mycolicibacterium smegmatis]ULN73351.1 NmrA family NAD(P)-binding protein [Mycolicibacterium smegmatis]